MTPYIPPSYPLKIRVLSSVPNAPRALITHARSCTLAIAATHNQVPREAEAAWPVDPSSVESAAPRTSLLNAGAGRFLCSSLPGAGAVPLYTSKRLLTPFTSRRGQGGAQGLDRAHSPLRLPPSTGHSENLPRPAACELGPHNAGPATRSSSAAAAARLLCLTVLNCLQLCKPSTFGPQKKRFI